MRRLYIELRAYWWALEFQLIALYWLMRRTFQRLRRLFPRVGRGPKQPLTILSIPTGELRTLIVRCPMCGRLQLVWVHRHVDGYTLYCENEDGCGQVTVKLPS